MFAKALFFLALGATATLGAVTELKTCAITAKNSSGLAGTGKITKDGETHKVAIAITTADADTNKVFVSKAASEPTTAAATADNVEVTGFTLNAVLAETSKDFPGGAVTKDNVKYLVFTKTALADVTGICTFTDVTTSGAAMLTIPVLAAAGLAMSLTL